jgi:hypothetical protein
MRVLSVCPFAKFTFPPLDGVFSPFTAAALRLCRATEKTPSSGGNKRRATAKSLNDFP